MGEKDRLKKTVPMDAMTTLDICDKGVNPVIHCLFKILPMQPVSTVSAERSFLFLRRLSGLASMVINKNIIRPKDS